MERFRRLCCLWIVACTASPASLADDAELAAEIQDALARVMGDASPFPRDWPACINALRSPTLYLPEIFDEGEMARMASRPTAWPSGHANATHSRFQDPERRAAIDRLHADCFESDPFPSAKKCQKCHPGHYREWSVSPHAYAQLSPVFNAMSSKLITLNNGTLGDFCIRCHTPVGMSLGEPVDMSTMDRHPAAREGVTCIVCHRTNQAWGKVSGRQSLVPGDLSSPVYGPSGNAGLQEVLENPDLFGAVRLEPSTKSRGRLIHRQTIPFFQMSTSGFCGTCHDVFAPNGFRLEDALSEYKASPAAKKMQSCQDCHMGKEHGIASGFDIAPAAKLGNSTTRPGRRTNHMMVGPDYSIVHPALFPHNPQMIRETHPAGRGDVEQGLATIRQWLLFRHDDGWGTPEFEQQITAQENARFPPPWRDPATRYRARRMLEDQFELLGAADAARHQLLATGYRLDSIQMSAKKGAGVRLRVRVWNGTEGHSVPTGFDAERLVFLRVVVRDRNGCLVYQSGDLDPNGDVRDSHSAYVHNGLLPIDRDLFSLQSRFLTRNVRGGEREQVLNVPFSLDPLPYTRPATRPHTVLGRPVGARKHKQNLEVHGSRWARYFISSECLTGDGPYTCQIELVAGMVPVNLIQAIASAGFDYGLSAREVADRVVAGHMVLHTRLAVLPVDAPSKGN